MTQDWYDALKWGNISKTNANHFLRLSTIPLQDGWACSPPQPEQGGRLQWWMTTRRLSPLKQGNYIVSHHPYQHWYAEIQPYQSSLKIPHLKHFCFWGLAAEASDTIRKLITPGLTLVSQLTELYQNKWRKLRMQVGVTEEAKGFLQDK